MTARDALLLDLFDANKTVDADYRPTVGGGFLDSAEGIVGKDTLVYVPGGYTTVGELSKVGVGGFAMTGGRRRRSLRKKTQRKSRNRNRNRNRSTFRLNLRAQIRLRSRSQRRH